MSTQLILYPQNYEGEYNLISNVPSEKIVDGITFNSINTSSSANVPSAIPSAHITFAQPNVINSWYRSRSTVTGTPNEPDMSGGNLYLYSVSAYTTSGVYQKLSNLIIGQYYDLFVTFDSATTGEIFIGAYNSSTGITINNQQQLISTLSLNFTVFQFQAQTTTDIVQINYTNTTADTFKITAVSVVPTGVTPSLNNFSLTDGQVICDLYQEEDIPLTLSIDDFKNVAEQVQSYSKDFNLPATKRNNLIFNNMFEVTRADDGLIFNPYVKTQCVLKQDGFILFQGYLRMLDVQDKDGEISYNVNLYSEVVALADVLKNKTFNDITFPELQHVYNKTNIKASWTTGLIYDQPQTSGFRDSETLKYPFVDWNHQMLISDGSQGTVGYPELGNLEQAFRPFLNIRYLIDRIFQDTIFTWSSDFFNTADFGKMYMDFNWGSAEYGAVDWAGSQLWQQDGMGSNYFVQSPGWKKLRFNVTVSGDNSLWDNTNYTYTSTVPNLSVTIGYHIRLTSVASSATYSNEVRIAKFDVNNNLLEELVYNSDSIAAGDTKTIGQIPSALNVWPFEVSTVLNLNEYIQVQSRVLTDNKIKMDTINPSELYFTSQNDGALTSTLLASARQDVGQWEFLKGIMTMFNLVSIPDESNPNNILFEPYNDVFISDTSGLNLASRSIEYDWTDKVDVSEMKLTPLTNLNKNTIFKFVEDNDDFAFNLYKKNTPDNHLYGSLKWDASDLTILEGMKEIVASPFAATVIKPLMSNYLNIIVPTIYTMDDDGVTESFENSPRIMYNNGVKSTGITYYIPAQNGLSGENQANFLQFSHLTKLNPTVTSSPPLATDTEDFHFGACQLIAPVGNPVSNNLFNNYWLPYYSELYNADTRFMTLKVNLSPSDINVFKMYDTVMIKNRSFRVNKIEYKPNDLATVEFILIP